MGTAFLFKVDHSEIRLFLLLKKDKSLPRISEMRPWTAAFVHTHGRIIRADKKMGTSKTRTTSSKRKTLQPTLKKLSRKEAGIYCPSMQSQKSFFDKETKRRYSRKCHGGVTKGKRKLERPLSSKKWIHLTLKSEKAKGKLSLRSPLNQTYIDKLLKRKSQYFGVRIADHVNMGNHLHIKCRSGSRIQFQKFLKSITALTARKVSGARRGKPFGMFWTGLAHTRILTSRFEELRLKGYFQANRVEFDHGYGARESYLESFEGWLRRFRASTS